MVLPFIKFILLAPVRKAAGIPLVLLTAVLGAGAYGAFDLTRGTCRVILQPELDNEKRRPGTDLTASLAALCAGAGVWAVREMRRPAIPAPPDLPTGDGVPLGQRLKNAGLVTRHVLAHFPYRFRLISVFIGGSLAGAAYAVTEKAYEIQGRRAKAAAAAAAALAAVPAAAAPEAAIVQASAELPMPAAQPSAGAADLSLQPSGTPAPAAEAEASGHGHGHDSQQHEQELQGEHDRDLAPVNSPGEEPDSGDRYSDATDKYDKQA